MKKLFLLIFANACFLAAGAAHAGGKCAAKEAHLKAYCSHMNEMTCGMANSQCAWEENDEKVVRVIVEKAEKKCVAKEGMEVHESFCNGQSKATCRVHSLCTWE